MTATIPVEIEDVDSEKFPITIDAGNTKPAKDYEVGTMTSDPESITISGPTSLINKISSVVAKVDVTNMRNSGTVTADLMIIDKTRMRCRNPRWNFEFRQRLPAGGCGY